MIDWIAVCCAVAAIIGFTIALVRYEPYGPDVRRLIAAAQNHDQEAIEALRRDKLLTTDGFTVPITPIAKKLRLTQQIDDILKPHSREESE
jgi:hypothetical protein